MDARDSRDFFCQAVGHQKVYSSRYFCYQTAGVLDIRGCTAGSFYTKQLDITVGTAGTCCQAAGHQMRKSKHLLTCSWKLESVQQVLLLPGSGHQKMYSRKLLPSSCTLGSVQLALACYQAAGHQKLYRSHLLQAACSTEGTFYQSARHRSCAAGTCCQEAIDIRRCTTNHCCQEAVQFKAKQL